MAKFRNIEYGKMLYETLRAYFSVNAAGEMSMLYKFCAAIIQPLQQPFDDYNTFRIRASIIATCKWQIGQATNVLNYLFDNVENRIFFTQSVLSFVSDPTFPYPAINSDPVFGEDPPEQERCFFDMADRTIVTINIPNTVSVPAITAVVEQIILTGIPYQIQVI